MLKGKTIIVTGAGRGIGKAIAEICAKNGANVLVQDIVLESAQETAKELSEKYGVKCEAIGGDVSKKEDALAIAEAGKKLAGGKIWGLVNNAGITRDAFLKKMTEEQWDKVIAVNLKGVFLVTQACIEDIEEGGAVVNISSMVAKSGNMGQTNYCATKAGVLGFTKALAKEYARKQIRCNCIQPGFIKTPMTAKIPEKVVQKFLTQIPFGRMGEPEDIAKAALFLLSDLSSYITGFSIEVAGGLFM
ncbi:MAG: 3-oxoacyl-ACP reductase FabG [Promethearchaeota archaeon]